MPKVSVVMSIYNVQEYLSEAIESILNQTFKDFEFIIINDGSKDGSKKIVRQYMKKDKRIIFIDRKENKGLVYSLNEGISIAKGKYIARMDGDDISLPNRLELQVKFLDKNPEVGVVGGHFYVISEKGKYMDVFIVPIEEPIINVWLSVAVPMAHPSIMVRKAVLNKYNIKYENYIFPVSQDYHLLLKISKYAKLSNVNEFILKLRSRRTSVWHTKTVQSMKKRYILSSMFIKENKLLLEKFYKKVLKLELNKGEKFNLMISTFMFALIHNKPKWIFRVLRQYHSKYDIISFFHILWQHFKVKLM